ncbi:MAG: hypothetical protein ACM3Q1_05075 [Bacteroidales bacterium]
MIRFVLAILCATASIFPAAAQQPGATHQFKALLMNGSPAGSTDQCLIFSGNGTDKYPSRHNWGTGPYCGFPGGKDALLANKQAVWTFTPISDTENLYTISNDSGPDGSQCLIFSGNGTDQYPSRYNWGSGPYCGFPGGKDALLANKQAVFRIEWVNGSQFIIKNAAPAGAPEQCLIFGGNGTEQFPSRYNWGSGPYCGFPGGKTALLDNKQAIFTFQVLN